MKIVIGLVGPPLAGKETVGEIIVKLAPRYGFSASRERFRDILEETIRVISDCPTDSFMRSALLAFWALGTILEKWNLKKNIHNRYKLFKILSKYFPEWWLSARIELNRPNLQKLAEIMTEKKEGFGLDAISNAIRNRLMKNRADVVIADGVRWPSDEKLIKSFPENRGVMLSIEASIKTRFSRVKKRYREGESEITITEFLRQDQAPTETNIVNIGRRADWWISNDRDDYNDLENKVKDFLRDKIKPLLQARE